MKTGESLGWKLSLPPRARLGFGVAMNPEAWILRGDGIWVTLSLRAPEDSSWTTLWDQWICPRDLPDHRRWIDVRVDLEAWSGREVMVRWECAASPPEHDMLKSEGRDQGESLVLSTPWLRSAPRSSRDAAANVLVIVIDTLRQDALHCFGNPAPVSPRLDALAAEGLRFLRAWAPSSWTHPSTASLLSGWRPSQHGLGMGPAGTTHLHPDTPLLALDFQAAGYATAAFSANRIVSVDEGFARGFDHFDLRACQNEPVFSAQRLTRFALQWLESHRDQPFFAYLHYFDPHGPYQAPPPYTRRFVDTPSADRRIPAGIRQGRTNPLRDSLQDSTRAPAIAPDRIRYLQGLYDGEVAYVDHWIGRLLEGLREWDLLDRTLVVVTSDHGEEFYEHGFFQHGHSLHEELVRIPLILRFPSRGGPALASRRISTPVSLLDLAPTLRDFAELSRDDEDRARSWLRWLESDSAAVSPALPLANYSVATGRWAGRQRALVQWPWKWIENRGPDRDQLFDLSRDPSETLDLAAEEPRLRRQMRELYTRLFGEGPAPAAADSPVDPVRLEKLRALGYVH